MPRPTPIIIPGPTGMGGDFKSTKVDLSPIVGLLTGLLQGRQEAQEKEKAVSSIANLLYGKREEQPPIELKEPSGLLQPRTIEQPAITTTPTEAQTGAVRAGVALAPAQIGQELASFLFPKQGKPTERRIVKDIKGVERYVDTGEPVFPQVSEPTLQEQAEKERIMAEARQKGVVAATPPKGEPLTEFQTIQVAAGVPLDRVRSGALTGEDANKILVKKGELSKTTDSPTLLKIVARAEGVDLTKGLKPEQADKVIKRYTKEFGTQNLLQMLLGGGVEGMGGTPSDEVLTDEDKKRMDELRKELRGK